MTRLGSHGNVAIELHLRSTRGRNVKGALHGNLTVQNKIYCADVGDLPTAEYLMKDISGELIIVLGKKPCCPPLEPVHVSDILLVAYMHKGQAIRTPPPSRRTPLCAHPPKSGRRYTG
jgi:hypothetical protein